MPHPDFPLVFPAISRYSFTMRQVFIWLPLLCCLAVTSSSRAATGHVLKVLPHFLDTNGVHTLSPSLYERDAYQAHLRDHPAERSAIRFDIQWKSKGPVWEPLKLKLELRGIAEGNLPRQLTLEQPVEPTGWFGRWTGLTLGNQEYRTFGEVIAWRVTLWENDQLIGEQKSFLW